MTKLYPWQEKLLIDIESGGYKPGELTVMMSGRQTGKSQLSSQAFKRLWEDLHNQLRPVEELILSEGTVLDVPYYTVEPVGGSWAEMEAWTTTAFGQPAEVWDIGPKTEFIWPELGRWYMNNRKFWFRDVKDRDWFVLRWNA